MCWNGRILSTDSRERFYVVIVQVSWDKESYILWRCLEMAASWWWHLGKRLLFPVKVSQDRPLEVSRVIVQRLFEMAICQWHLGKRLCMSIVRSTRTQSSWGVKYCLEDDLEMHLGNITISPIKLGKGADIFLLMATFVKKTFLLITHLFIIFQIWLRSISYIVFSCIQYFVSKYNILPTLQPFVCSDIFILTIFFILIVETSNATHTCTEVVSS